MLAHLARMVLQALPAHLVVRRLLRGEVRGEWHLRIDDDLLPSGQPNDQVGAESTVLRRCRDLLVEVAVGEHSGDLDHALELDLAPPAPGVWSTERVLQGRGLLTEVGQMPAQLAVPLRTRTVELLNALAHRSKRLLERLDGPFELRRGELHERRVGLRVGFERR